MPKMAKLRLALAFQNVNLACVESGCETEGMMTRWQLV